MEKIKEISDNLCTGCGVCKNVCPVDAISMNYLNGYLKPQKNVEKCVSCNKCDRICPVINRDSTKLPSCYAAWADDKTRFKSSSGGAFSVLAKIILNVGGVVFGAAWTDGFYVKHTYIEFEADLEILCRSKYVQSDVGDSYKRVMDFLKLGRMVMFVGTPCQVAGLERYLEDINKEKLILVDFICYYNPPISVLHRYLDETYGLSKLKKFTFRDKSNGWLSHSTMAELKDGSAIAEKQVKSYFDGYFNGLYAREACINCTFSGNQHHSDLTLGDFWKIEEHDKSWNDGRGTSMIIANTLKGRLFVEHGKEGFDRLENVPMEWIRVGQTNCKKAHLGQAYFYDLLNYKSFDEAVKQSLHSKYDVGMVCVQSYKNYGSAFTNVALYKVLKDLKKSVLIITQPKCSVIKPEDTTNFVESPFKPYECASSYKDQEEMKALNEKCGIFLVGSDQLFNYEIYKQIDGFVKLNWVDDEHKKVCYATSFGVDCILGTFEESVNLKQSLDRFSAISIREESGVELVRTKFKCEATQVLDPVFLCQKQYYYDLCKDIVVESGGIFAYILDPSIEKENALNSISKKLNKDMTVYVDRWMSQEYLSNQWSLSCKLDMKNEYWLKSIMESNFVFTDSFHGMCMAIIFEKQFCVINNKKRGTTRFTSLLNKLGLMGHIFDTEQDFINSISDISMIDYTKVNEILIREKERSMEWLKSALNEKHSC